MFRIVDTYHQPALDYWKWVQRRNAAILPNIQAHVAAGTVVHSDQWHAYNSVSVPSNVAAHQSQPFSDFCGSQYRHAHTTVQLKRMKGCHITQLPSYLDELLWRETYGKTKSETFENIKKHISEKHPF